MRLRLAPAWIAGVSLIFLASLAHAQTRFRNVVNARFATVSSGPQSSVVIDLPRGTSAAAQTQAIETRLRREFTARARALAPVLRQSGKRAVLPLSTLVAVRQGGRLVTPPRSRVLGDGQLTFAFEDFNGAQLSSASGTPIVIEDFLKDFIGVVYPRLVALYGKPAFSGEVKVKSMGFFNTGTATDVQRLAFGAYSPSENRIYLPLYQSVESLAHAFLLNLIHAFHGAAVFQYDAWEQGFARAAASVIARDPFFNFSDPTANNLYTLLPFYDLLNQPALGNSTFFPPSQANILIDGEITIAKMLQARMGMSGAAWLKCWIEDPDFFKNFNAAYYAQYDPAASPSLAGNVPALRTIGASVLPTVEGLPFGQWFSQQYVLDTSVVTGPKLYAFVLPSVPNAANGDQSALVALVYYKTLPTGDEELLNGRAYATYYDATNARINLGIQAEQAAIEQGEGFLTTLAFPNQGFDDGRVTMDFSIGGITARTYLPSGLTGDLQAVFAGTVTGEVSATQTTVLAPITTRSKTGTISRSSLGLALGSSFGELHKTQIDITNGPTTTIFRRNTGDDTNYLVLRPTGAAGGVTTVSHDFPVGALQLASFPVQPLESSVEAALGRSATEFLLASWDPIPRTYAAVAPGQPSLGPLLPGKGYLLKFMPTGGPVNTTVSLTGLTPATDTDFTVNLSYGWNLVGSPFPGAVNLTDVLVKFLENDGISWAAANGTDANSPFGTLVATQLYDYNPTTGVYSPTDSFAGPWQGYWLRVFAPQGVSLILPGPDAPGRSVRQPGRAVVPYARPKPDWQVRLQAIAGERRSGVTLGAAAGATRGFDLRWDQEAPPDLSPGVSLGFASDFPLAGGRAASDFRSPSEAARGSWDVVLSSPRSETVTLTWDGLASLPRTLQLTLIDQATGQRYALASRSSVAIPITGGVTRKLRVVAEAQRTLPLAITGFRAVSQGRATGGAMRLEFGVTTDVTVQAEVSTLTGRVVKRLSAGRARAGEQTSLTWNGLNDTGQTLPAGTYLITLTARTDDGQSTRVQRPLPLLR